MAHSFTVSLLVFVCAWFPVSTESVFFVHIDSTRAINTVDDKYLSVTVDLSIIRHDARLANLTNRRLLTLTKALTPCYLRLGGTDEDLLYFQPNISAPEERIYVDETENLDRKELTKFNMTGTQLDQLMKFGVLTGTSLFFGLNVLNRRGDAWNSDNARMILDFIADRKFPMNLELGNEPNDFGKFNVSIDGEQLAADFETLKKLLVSYPGLKRALLVGPDIGQLKDKERRIVLYDKFIRHAAPLIDAVTWHQYYGDGRTATISDFMNADLLDDLAEQFATVDHVTRNYSPTLPIWLGETSTMYGGGSPGLSNRYVAGFMWLDKLGVASSRGMKVVMRQALVHGWYSLIDDDFQPLPDYWLSLLFKILVGRTVFQTQISPADKNVRVYAHCTNLKRTAYRRGAITLYGLNLMDDDVTLMTDDVRDFEPDLVTLPSSVDEFILTPIGGDLVSDGVLLNGEPLRMRDDVTLPPLIPREVGQIKIPSHSFGFFVLKNAQVSICM